MNSPTVDPREQGLPAPQYNPNQPTVPPPGVPRSKKKFVMGAVIVVLLLAAGGGAYWYLVKRKPSAQVAINQKEAQQQAAATEPIEEGSVFCVKVGLNSVQCENLNTKELRKYALPKDFKDTNTMVASPDGTKYLVSKYVNNVEDLSVYNSDLTLLAPMPVKRAADGSRDISQADWFNNQSLVYTKGQSQPKTTIYTFNADTKKEDVLITVDGTIERLIPAGTDKYMFGIQAVTNPVKNAIERKLVAIDLTNGSLKDIATPSVDVNSQTLVYSPVTQQFYANILHQQEQTFDIKIFKTDATAAKPTLTDVDLISNAYALAPGAYGIFITKAGIFATNDSTYTRAPLKFYTKTNTFTESTLAVGHNGGDITLSLPKFPSFPKAEKNEVVTSDFFNPPAGTPAKIVQFLQKQVNDTTACGKGEYTTFDIDKYDQDSQFSVFEANCNTSALVFYKADGDTYKNIAATQEGMSCEQRDKLGISALVLPDCLKPGEGL